jgi:LmbE family N-acetylglucosaminyl deacetylase
MKFLGKSNVLCLVPHPDDTAYSISGTVRKYQDTHFNMAYLTLGGYTDPSRGIQRQSEDDHFWSTMTNINWGVCYYPNLELETSPLSTIINDLETTISIKNYDMVLGPSEYDSNYDHVLVNRLMMPLVRSTAITTLEYRCASSLSEWVPNMFVDVTEEELEHKYNCLIESFPSQTDAPYFVEDNFRSFHVDYNSKKRGYGYCEMFKVRNYYV